MTGHVADEALQDWADDSLDIEDRTRIEAHLAECDTCARHAAALRALLDDLHALPRGIAPSRDLHAGIVARIDRPRVPRTTALLRLAAAVVALVGGAALGTVMLRDAPVDEVRFGRTHARYARATAELENALSMRRDGMPSGAAAALQSSLAAIEAALRESGEALANDPENVLLNELVLVGYERKLDVLRRATDSTTP